MAGTNETPGNKLHERLNQNRIKLWFFMGGKRLLVTGLLIIVVFITLLVTGSLYPAVETSIRSNDSVDTLFQALLTAIISGVTIVVSLNQLVLSQELGAVKDQRERMEGAMQFREDVADVIQAPLSPSRPAQFIRALVQVSAERAKNIQDVANNSADENFKQEINDFTNSLIKNSEQVAEELDGAQFGGFDVISSALNFNYSWKIFTILLSAIPALLTSCYMILFFNSKTYNIIIINTETLVLVTTLATTISLTPFLILISYVLRIVTITKYTLSIGSFILRETDKVEEVEWDQ